MKYKVTLNGKVNEVIVEKGQAILADEYEALAPAPAPAAAPAPVAAAAPAPAAKTASLVLIVRSTPTRGPRVALKGRAPGRTGSRIR